MRPFKTLLVFVVATVVAVAVSGSGARSQSALNLSALQGLIPFSSLLNTDAGKAAVTANFAVTAAIQHGTANQPSLQPLEAQREQAIKDAFITSGNAYELADGLGTSLGTAYQSLTTYASNDDGKTSTFTNISPSLATLFDYSSAVTAADAGSAKFFFSNETVVTKSGAIPVSSEAAALLTSARGTVDVYGKAYDRPAGSKGADPFGDSRPFQTEPDTVRYSDNDFFGVASSNDAYLNGPTQNLVGSPSFPSGHTTFGYTESLLLAILVPQRFTQMIARGAEYGNSRIVLGAHYAMDVIAGRTLAYYDIAHLLAQSPEYVGQTLGRFPVADYQAALASAKSDVAKALASRCGNTVVVCASTDTGRFSNSALNKQFYESTQTYGLPLVYQATAGHAEDVATLAPEAGFILTAAFPSLTIAQADRILTDAEGPGGGFLDNGSSFGVYSRLDLFKAAEEAATLVTPARSR